MVLRVTVLISFFFEKKRKIARGFANFEKNTGATHPNDNGSLKTVKKLAKRATGKDALTDDLDGDLWQGAISVGTPSNAFTGKVLE